MNTTPVMILAGGKGSRLGPLTTHRAKPSVPFAGRYRIIDFVLSNFLNSGYRRIYVLTQYMAHSLIRHLTRNWSTASGMFLEVTPAQMRKGSFWYRGTADAVYQNLNLLAEAESPNVAVFGGDQQERTATHTAMHARRVSPPSPAEPQLHLVNLAVRRRHLDPFRQRERRSSSRR